MRNRFRTLSSALVLTFAASGSVHASSEIPRVMAWTSYPTGSTGYVQAAALGGLLKEKVGSNIRIIPGRNDVARMMPLKNGQADYCVCGIASYFSQEGVFLFNNKDWGPQPVRVVISSQGTQGLGLAAANDDEINSISDLRGKRVIFVLGADAMNKTTEAVLAYGGLTWDDVVKFNVAGPNEAIEAMINGNADAMPVSTGNPVVERILASPRGMKWLQMPNETQEEKEAWKRTQHVAPYYHPYYSTKGNGVSAEKPWHGGGYGHPSIVTTDKQSSDEVYALTKFIYSNFDALSGSAPGAIGWALDRQNFNWVMPYHEGAVRYFKEAGVWSEQLEAHNQGLIQRQNVLQKAWQEHQAEGGDGETFSARWSDRRANALVSAGYEVPGIR